VPTGNLNMLRLKEKYIKEVIPVMKEKFGYKNDLAVPRIEKVVINTGFNPSIKDEKTQGEIAKDLSLITGQKPVPCQAKKGVASFKTREGMTIGFKITLRGGRMYDFIEKLIHVVLPRGRDFRGLEQKNVDQSGNLNIGIKEQIIFPEISTESAKNIFGLEVSVVTNTKDYKKGLELFKQLGFPIKK